MVTAGLLDGRIQWYQLLPMTQQGIEQRYAKLQVIKCQRVQGKTSLP